MGTDVVIFARFVLTGIAILLAVLAVAVWNRREEAQGANVFALLFFGLAIYTFGYAGEVAQTTVVGARRWLDIEYLALPWIPGLWLLGACRHNGLRVRTPLLFVIPAMTFVMHYTNFRNLFYTAPMTLVHRDPFWVLTVQRGPFSTLDNAYLLVAFLSGAWVYLTALRHASPLFRKQAAVLLISSFVPFVGYFLYLAGLSPWGLDIAPITLGITCIALDYGIFRCGVFELAPLARTLIFNSMRDAVLVLDTHDRLLDFNPAAKALLPVLNKSSVGHDALSLFSGTSGLVEALSGLEELVELNMTPLSGATNKEHAYEIRTWPLITNSREMGRAVIFADVTSQVRLREELRRRSETDPLTGIANRRRFYQALEIECIRYTRGHAPLSVLMIDLDHFKAVNDQYGHPTGDAVLRSVADLLLKSLRKTDLLARFGGEEFAILLPETRVEGACVIAERIRAAFCMAPIQADGVPISLTASIGVASHNNDQEVAPEILLKKSDLALYRAKATGRNRVEVA